MNDSVYYIDYVIEKVQKLLSIDSPTGYTGEVIQYLQETYESMGYETVITGKGGLLVLQTIWLRF